jgi:hypothetical protein
VLERERAIEIGFLPPQQRGNLLQRQAKGFEYDNCIEALNVLDAIESPICFCWAVRSRDAAHKGAGLLWSARRAKGIQLGKATALLRVSDR